MAFIKMNFNKEGKGVEKDSQPKNFIAAYFESYKRNFWNILKLDFIYGIAIIPMMLVMAALFTMLVYPHLEGTIMQLVQAAPNQSPEEVIATYFGVFAVVFMAVVIMQTGAGPASAAYSYVSKCFANEEHTWVWGDFKRIFKENFKQSIIVSVIDVILVFLLINAGYFYFTMHKSESNSIYLILLGVIVLVALFLSMMHGYIYQMIITFDNKLSVLFKNAFIMTLANLPQNFLLILVPTVITAWLFCQITPVFAAILFFTVWNGLMRYPMEYFAAKKIRQAIENQNG